MNQINTSNVNKLDVAWSYPTGDDTTYTFSPLVIDNIAYFAAKHGSLVAVDATTGKELWVHTFTAAAGLPSRFGGIAGMRGGNYWESKDRTDRRLLVSSGGFLQAIDARTGNLVDSFADHGKLDLKIGLDRASRPLSSRTPGRIFENILILGSATGEGYLAPPGDIRAFDVVTGKLLWVFHTIPRPGEFGYDTWPKDAYKYLGGVDVWGEITVDEKRGIAYFPVASAKYELYGGDRPGDNLYADCILALDARTGKHLWHFQTIHHDVWDYDPDAAPQLVTVKHDGKTVDAVALASKNDFLYVFDRVTGKPLWPIEERPVPASDVPGEVTSKTQPIPDGSAPIWAPGDDREGHVRRVHEAGRNPLVERPSHQSENRFLYPAGRRGRYHQPSERERRRIILQHRRRCEERHGLRSIQRYAVDRQARAGRRIHFSECGWIDSVSPAQRCSERRQTRFSDHRGNGPRRL